MITLKQTLQSLNNPDIKTIAKNELQKLDSKLLPLQQGLSYSSAISNSPFSIVILNIEEKNDVVNIKSGIFYTGIIAGCSCSDDPTPMDEQNEYCEIMFSINKTSAETTVTLLND